MTRLANHIVSRHHAYLRDVLPQLGSLLDQVVSKHADKHPNLVEIREVYTTMWNELLNHMLKEEVVLFPFIRSLDEAAQAGRPAPRLPLRQRGCADSCYGGRAPEHGEALRRMRN